MKMLLSIWQIQMRLVKLQVRNATKKTCEINGFLEFEKCAFKNSNFNEPLIFKFQVTVNLKKILIANFI